jgi:4-carboxymuconolactone decarboxylase
MGDHVAADDEDRAAAGRRRYLEVYGDDAVTFPPGQADFFDLMMQHLFDGVWNRPGLTIEQRRLITMGVLAAQHHFDVLRLQFERSLVAGELNPAQVRELAIHLIAYVGYPSSGAIFRAGEDAIAAVADAAG